MSATSVLIHLLGEIALLLWGINMVNSGVQRAFGSDLRWILLRRGWEESDVALLTWGNVQRVLRAATFTAHTAQQRRKPSTATITALDG